MLPLTILLIEINSIGENNIKRLGEVIMTVEDFTRVLPLFALALTIKYWFFTFNIPMAIISIIIHFITCVISGKYNG